MKHNRNYINELNESLSISLSLYQALSHYPSLSLSLSHYCLPAKAPLRIKCKAIQALEGQLFSDSQQKLHQ